MLRAGWQWAAVEGPAELVGPDDDLAGLDGEGRPCSSRIFPPPGHPRRLGEYDRVMAEDRRAAVLIDPQRVYGNS